VAARRVLTISLPNTDPATVAIQAWLDGLPADADLSAEVRRLLADAIRIDARLAGIETQLARIGVGVVAPAPTAPGLTPAQAATLDVLLDFD
jgi:hypothetical protein